MNGWRPVWLALLLACAALAAAPFAAGRTAVVDGTGTIAGSGTSYTIVIANTGTDPILCFQVVLPAGGLATGIGAPPSGWQLGSSGPPPAPIFGGRSTTGLAPGAAETFSFTTSRALSVGAQLKLSSDCRTDVTVATTGPTAPPPPPAPTPKPAPCKCDELDVELEAPPGQDRKDSVVLALRWSLECTKGIGEECRGTLAVALASAARQAGLKVTSVISDVRSRKLEWTVTCESKCKRLRAVTRKGTAAVIVDAKRGERFGRDVGAVTIEVDRYCGGRQRTRTFRVAFNPDGLLSRRRSDLNGNGTPDASDQGR